MTHKLWVMSSANSYLLLSFPGVLWSLTVSEHTNQVFQCLSQESRFSSRKIGSKIARYFSSVEAFFGTILVRVVVMQSESK